MLQPNDTAVIKRYRPCHHRGSRPPGGGRWGEAPGALGAPVGYLVPAFSLSTDLPFLDTS